MRGILISLMVVGVVAVIETDAYARCFNWGCVFSLTEPESNIHADLNELVTMSKQANNATVEISGGSPSGGRPYVGAEHADTT
jgi:hypothetical protein